MNRIKAFCITNFGRLLCAAGAGGAGLHFCTHPCLEHALLAFAAIFAGVWTGFRHHHHHHPKEVRKEIES